MKKKIVNNNGITAIYVRRSVSDKDKGNNSLSISAQREECIRFVGDCEYQVWLAVQDKKAHNKRIPNNANANHSWLTGFLKCGHCGYHLEIHYYDNAKSGKRYRYLRDSEAYRKEGCVKSS